MRTVDVDCKTAAKNVQARFEHWRNTRNKRGPIPSELWSAAIRLTEHYSAFYVSKLLKLNYTSFKNRISSTFLTTCPENEQTPFIELPSLPSYNSEHCQIDIRRTDGSQMQIRLQQHSQTELSSLVQAFLG